MVREHRERRKNRENRENRDAGKTGHLRDRAMEKCRESALFRGQKLFREVFGRFGGNEYTGYSGVLTPCCSTL